MKSSIRPARPTSVASIIAIIFMILFGLGFAVIVGNVLHENDAPLIAFLAILLFMIGWIGTAVYLLIYHIKNINRPQGVPLFEVETESGPGDARGETDFARKLRDLEQLKKDGLINQEEYSRKRSEIMAEKWR
jgi:hypothetical protein